MSKYVLSFILIAFISSGIYSQTDARQHEQWRKEMNDAKCEYIAKELDLSREQKEKFLPLYNAMSSEIDKINHGLRQMRKNITKRKDVSDIEYEKAAEAMFEAKGKENRIEMEYFDKYKEILSKKQLFQLKHVEFKWLRQIMKHRKGHHHKRPEKAAN